MTHESNSNIPNPTPLVSGSTPPGLKPAHVDMARAMAFFNDMVGEQIVHVVQSLLKKIAISNYVPECSDGPVASRGMGVAS